MSQEQFDPLPLAEGIAESYIPTADLTYHVLSAGHPTNPLILLLHGFPELAYSWRKIMLPLASANYRVVAYDQRGYGRTTGWDARPFAEVDLQTFQMTRLVADALRLVSALGYRQVECVIGHDFGAVGASLCALVRGDVFKSAILMSHPFVGMPPFPFPSPSSTSKPDIQASLAALSPPRKHYKYYYSTASASSEMTHPKSNLQSFLRGYFHLKSADWAGNTPQPLTSFAAPELEKMPHYYIMPLNASMPETIAQDMNAEDPASVASKSTRWLPDEELEVFVKEWQRNGFQGGLNWYRIATDPGLREDLNLFAGKTIDIPVLYIAGKQDWGTYQEPGAVEGMEETCTKFHGVEMVEGAGHWVMQEQPEEVMRLGLKFLGEKGL